MGVSIPFSHKGLLSNASFLRQGQGVLSIRAIAKEFTVREAKRLKKFLKLNHDNPSLIDFFDLDQPTEEFFT